MRKILAEKFKLNQREKYKATFKRFGLKNGYKGDIKTVLLIDVIDQYHKLVASHLWMNCGKEFDKLELNEGEFVQFYARVKIYEKGTQSPFFFKELRCGSGPPELLFGLVKGKTYTVEVIFPGATQAGVSEEVTIPRTEPLVISEE